ncbi:SanA/YdcF family protein [Polaribacter ponticola]|uniref:ElyC/SanA/YdcF family protein n=1 Tax=Polaribacter ponticola TaxID=2978475 RepID=A0ABT5S978_9FLAO|nr:ElyC/SanA/YdcF family protein [Polaribacter sp. MSW5]MDD7914669.1 ElyC/SanA/YdcF family protein [Polaribacter sp. MSW5]
MNLNWFKIIKKTALIGFILSAITIILSNLVVNQNAKEKVFTDTSKIPKNKVGLLLGTSKILEGGEENLYFIYRVNAAVKLFKSKKIDFILISSSYESKYNDNPQDFKIELLKKGIPKNKILLDYGGNRTLNSVIRIKEIYNQQSVTMISQEFHNERAIFLAESYGINAVGFNAKDVTNRLGLKTQTREYFARVKVFVDIFFKLQPKFLGEKVKIK